LIDLQERRRTLMRRRSTVSLLEEQYSEAVCPFLLVGWPPLHACAIGLQQDMYARIRDTEIFFDIDGASLVHDGSFMRERPTAFLVHGGPGGDHTGFKARYGPLAEKMQLVYFDHRGHGRSARGDPQSYTLDENVEDMECLRRHLGLERIVTIGVSYGGMVALAHAARYPDSVSHLIAIATAAHSGYVVRARQIAAERGTAEQVALCDDLFEGRLDTREKLRRYYEAMATLYGRRHDPVLLSQSLERAILCPEALNRAHGPGGFLRTLDLRPELKKVKAPTMIIAGRHDWICAPEFSEEIHRLIADSDLRIFEESAHYVAGDEPEKLLDAIRGFLIYRNAGRIS
jgi:proline iminopeptidase